MGAFEITGLAQEKASAREMEKRIKLRLMEIQSHLFTKKLLVRFNNPQFSKRWKAMRKKLMDQILTKNMLAFFFSIA